MQPKELENIYHTLLDVYGLQGWWPVLGSEASAGNENGIGYHPGDYSVPRDDAQRFEICVGAILTQNTAWRNVERALLNLLSENAITPQAIRQLPESKIKEAIRPSGYFNVKTRKLREFTKAYLQFNNATPSREQLLNIWGVGPETADSIRLYAYHEPEMVVDAYTQRIFSHLNLCAPQASYDDVKHLCEENLPRNVRVYQELHALLVEHAKHYYSRSPYADEILMLK